VITPGSNKDEILRVVTALGPAFDQVVLLGYPPFLKDVIDTGDTRGVPWSDYALKLVLAGEVFSEEWRSLAGERIRGTQPCYDSVSLYGSADAESRLTRPRCRSASAVSWRGIRRPLQRCSASPGCPRWPSTTRPTACLRPMAARCCFR
jgi:hypothetical protein